MSAKNGPPTPNAAHSQDPKIDAAAIQALLKGQEETKAVLAQLVKSIDELKTARSEASPSETSPSSPIKGDSPKAPMIKKEVEDEESSPRNFTSVQTLLTWLSNKTRDPVGFLEKAKYPNYKSFAEEMIAQAGMLPSDPSEVREFISRVEKGFGAVEGAVPISVTCYVIAYALLRSPLCEETVKLLDKCYRENAVVAEVHKRLKDAVREARSEIDVMSPADRMKEYTNLVFGMRGCVSFAMTESLRYEKLVSAFKEIGCSFEYPDTVRVIHMYSRLPKDYQQRLMSREGFKAALYKATVEEFQCLMEIFDRDEEHADLRAIIANKKEHLAALRKMNKDAKSADSKSNDLKSLDGSSEKNSSPNSWSFGASAKLMDLAMDPRTGFNGVSQTKAASQPASFFYKGGSP